MKHFLIAAMLSTAALVPLCAQAQLHDGDIEMSVVNNRIVLTGNDAFHADGAAIFEGDFGDLGGGPYSTDDPGFDSEGGSFAAGTLINYAALGSLRFWNGTQWGGSVPAAEFVRLDGNLGEDTRFTATGVVGSTSGLIGQAGAGGVIHEHLDMSVARTGGGVPTVGAYLIQLQLTSASHLSSAPFYLALNHGLSEQAFEDAVIALAVPEVHTWALLAIGLTVLGLRHRVRRG